MEMIKMIGRFAVQKPLDNSAYAAVYLATDTVLNRIVRLNVFNPVRIKKKSVRLALHQALQQAADLVHPHIAWIWDLGEEDGAVYAAERFVDGPALDRFLQINQRMTWDQAHLAFRQAAQALEFAHARKVLHGDLSPGNLVLSPELGAVLMNFGLYEVFHPNTEITRYSDQSDLARLLITMVSGRVDIPDEPNLDDLWSLNAPQLVSGALKRALGLVPDGPYSSAEEFAAAVNELANRPQPPLSPEQLQRLENEEAQWREAREKALQAAEEATRREALDEARREINEQLQRAIDESARLDQGETEAVVDQVPSNLPGEGEIQSSQPGSQTAEAEPLDSSGETAIPVAGSLTTADDLSPSSKKAPPAKPKRRVVIWTIIILLLIVLLAAIAWAFISGYWNTIFPL